jgi:hypothetical protein
MSDCAWNDDKTRLNVAGQTRQNENSFRDVERQNHCIQTCRFPQKPSCTKLRLNLVYFCAYLSVLAKMSTISVRAFIPRPILRTRVCSGCRRYAVQSPGTPTIQVFNNHTKWLQKERAASDPENSRQVDYLRDEVASRLCERLLVRFIKKSCCKGIDKIRISNANSPRFSI